MLLREDDELPSPIEPADPLDLETAVEDDVDPMDMPAIAAFESGGDGHATVLLDRGAPAPPPVPADAAFGITRSSKSPLVADPDRATDAVLATPADAGDPLDFGFESEEVPAESTSLRSATPLVADPDVDPADDLFESELAPSAAPVAAPAAPQAAPPPVASPAPAAHLEALRGELREHLEKVAWEAFGDLSERIVRETVARVEAVAWEVIPQMAEALIREEIRKLQTEE